MSETKEALEPCPHCGPGQSQVDLCQLHAPYWQVICGACGAASGTMPESERWPNARQLIIDGWNKRYTSDAIAALIAERDALREALKPFGEEAEAWGNHVKDNRTYYVPEDCEACFTFGDLRRARDLLK